jgi:iron(III) transport system permease protein
MTTRLGRQAVSYAAVLPLLWVLVAFVLFPVLNTVGMSVRGTHGFSLEFYRQFFTYEKNLEAFLNTILLGLATVVVCGLVGSALAFFVNSFDFPGKRLIDLFLLAPIMLPGVVITIAFMQLYGESGLVTKTIQYALGLTAPPFALKGFGGILFIHAYTQYVFFYVNVSAALRRIDNSVVESARNLGAGRARVFFTITLPLLTPALAASSVLTFMSGVGSFAAPSLIGGSFRVMSVQILMSKVNNFLELTAVQGIMMSLVSICFLALVRFLESRREYALVTKGVLVPPREIRGPAVRAFFVGGAGILTAFVALPILAIGLLAFVKQGTWVVDIYPTQFGLNNFALFFRKQRVVQPFINSFAMSAAAGAAAVVVGAFAAYVIVKTRLAVRWLVEILVLLPWALPASAVAVNMINAFNVRSVFSFGAILVGTWWILPLSYSVSMVTLVVRSTSASLRQLHDSLEEASRSLGAPWLSTFRRVVVPIVLPGILAGGMIGFVGALGDYTTSALMYTVHNMPISIAMTNALYQFDIGLAMAYGVVQVVLTSAVILAVRRMGGMGELRF